MRGEIVQYQPIPVESFTIREIAELLRDGYIYLFRYQGDEYLKAGLGPGDI